MKTSILNLFRDKQGNIVIIQKPNLYIFIASILYLISLFFNDPISIYASLGFKAVLIFWALDELFRGDSNFRKALGLFVFILIIFNILTTIGL